MSLLSPVQNQFYQANRKMSDLSTTTDFRCEPRHGGWALIALVCLVGCSQTSNEYVEPPPREVSFAYPILAPITPFVDQTGITEAAYEAEVRSRVRGFLQTIEFESGQSVKQGDLLYTIEKEQYDAAYEVAKASEETAEAAIGVAEAAVKTAEAAVLKAAQDLEREERLKEQNASSQAQYDAAVAETEASKASLESARANVKAAQSTKHQAEAAVRQAKLELDYTDVHAVIDGRITKTNFKVGNLVENGSHLTTIVDANEIFANFSVSDRAALRIMSARNTAGLDQQSPDQPFWRDLPVYLAREGDIGYPFEGKVNDVDQAGVDAATGTLGIRGVFENSENQLLPGLFVTLRVPIFDAVNSLVIPERAILRDQQGTFVLAVGEDNVVVRAPIDFGQAVGGWAIVLGGIEPTTRVIVDGLQFARTGGKVLPNEAKFEIDATMLIRGLSNPDRSETTPQGTSKIDPSNESNQPTVK